MIPENSYLTLSPLQATMLKRQLSNDFISAVEYIVKMHWMISATTIFFDGLDDVVDSLKAAHFAVLEDVCVCMEYFNAGAAESGQCQIGIHAHD